MPAPSRLALTTASAPSAASSERAHFQSSIAEARTERASAFRVLVGEDGPVARVKSAGAANAQRLSRSRSRAPRAIQNVAVAIAISLWGAQTRFRLQIQSACRRIDVDRGYAGGRRYRRPLRVPVG